jgi:hypothetical protein
MSDDGQFLHLPAALRVEQVALNWNHEIPGRETTSAAGSGPKIRESLDSRSARIGRRRSSRWVRHFAIDPRRLDQCR